MMETSVNQQVSKRMEQETFRLNIPAKHKSKMRPNFLIITTDQQRLDTLSCYGSTVNNTPNLDRLRTEGALFTRAYCTNPVCTPARVSLFTGLYPSRHGAWNVGLNTDDSIVMISHRLVQDGYRTHYIGKTHFQAFMGNPAQTMEPTIGWKEHYPDFNGPYYGFEKVELAFGHTTYGITGHYGAWVRGQVGEEEFQSYQKCQLLGTDGFNFHGNACDWNLPLRFHNSVWTADRTIEFLKNQSEDQPFLLAIGFQDPHHPHALPLEYQNCPKPGDVPLPVYYAGELDDKPPHFNAARLGQLEESSIRGEFMVAGQGLGADFSKVSEEDARLGRAYYYGMVRLIDEQVGRILDCLDEQGLAENTLVIFTTDHGELLGDHGIWMKGPFLYEQLVNIPMLMRWPAGIPAGKKIRALTSQVDIVPTILAAAMQEIPIELDGRNLLPLLHGEPFPELNAVFVECVDDPSHLRMKTIITQDRKMSVYANQTYGELYDLDKDPGEIANLWTDPAYSEDRTRLFSLLMAHMEPLEKRSPRIAYA